MKTIKKNETIHIGNVAVDSGQILIVDPCYLSEWKDGEYGDLKSHYGRACHLTSDTKNLGGEMIVSGIAGTGVAASSGYGDGLYPVIATYKDGRIKKLEIHFF